MIFSTVPGRVTEESELDHAAVPSAVEVAAGMNKNTTKRSGMVHIAQQHTQNWIDS
jgi:hypothetical protein